MIPAKQAHEMSAAARKRRETAQLLADLANVERAVLKAADAGDFSIRLEADSFVSPATDVVVALLRLGYFAESSKRRGKIPLQVHVAWGAPKPVSP